VGSFMMRYSFRPDQKAKPALMRKSISGMAQPYGLYPALLFRNETVSKLS
jgi:hypothetical protein